MAKPAAPTYFQYLDGFRGIAALWVMIGHILIVYRIPIKIIGWPALAVDLFILISGFLMVRQAIARKQVEPLSSPTTWTAFWLRRFFRIAPLYFSILFIAILIAQSERGFDGSFRYLLSDGDHIANGAFMANLVSHVTFLFGLSPNFASAIANVPDWSISLEMQFYALFPFLMLLGERIGWMLLTAVIAATCVAAGAIFATFLQEFFQPSIIVLKINVFMGGMLIALALEDRKRSIVYVMVAAALMLLPLWGSFNFRFGVLRALICAGFGAVALCDGGKGKSAFSSVFSYIARTLGTKPFAVMAELSYGLYLVHFFVINTWSRLTAPDAILAHMGGQLTRSL